MSSDDRASKGGHARARALDPEERKEIARLAAEARWGGIVTPKATHTGELEIAGATLSCAVLETGKRLFTQGGFLTALGRAEKAKGGHGSVALVDGLPPFLTASNLKPFISEDLRESTTPIVFRPPTGRKAFGYEVDILPMVCEVYLNARDAGVLLPVQEHIAKRCDLIMRGLARVGIIALVDEATGYQEVRDRLALQAILEKYLTDEWAGWTKTFPDEFYRQLLRLRKLNYPDPGKRPAYIGHLTNDIVYKRLAPGVLNSLKERNPIVEGGYRKRKHHQHFTRDLGHPALTEHIAKVTFLMKACSTWEEFKKKLRRAAPVYDGTIPMELDD